MIVNEVLRAPQNFKLRPGKLGEAVVDSPLKTFYTEDSEEILISAEWKFIQEQFAQGIKPASFEKAGPRSHIYHPPFSTRAAIVTCGGLCPGLNGVIKGVVETLYSDYQVNDVFGIPYGYLGLTPASPAKPMRLDPEIVDTIHEQGGSILGSSRGPQDPKVMVDTLVNMRINLLFCIGGDGTLRGAHDIAEEVKQRGLDISVIGIPKTIDNDLNFVGRTFGFETAVYHSSDIITCAHMEAKSHFNGLGLVKLMGRDSGFIAAHACLANTVVNFCLIPEMPVTLEGEKGLLAMLERRFKSKDHAVIVVAEGAGQNLMEGPEEVDASGNILKKDIGEFLHRKIQEHFKEIGVEVNIKYFDPSYLIRSVPAKGTDAIFCHLLAEMAVHAGMAGKTDLVIGQLNRQFIHVPIELATRERQKIDIKDYFWKAVLSSTQQEAYYRGD